MIYLQMTCITLKNVYSSLPLTRILGLHNFVTAGDLDFHAHE